MEIENTEAEEKCLLKPIRDLTNEYISLCNTYKSFAPRDLAGGMDANVEDARDTLKQAENFYKSTPPAEREGALSLVQALTDKIREAVTSIRGAVKHAEECKRAEEMSARINSSS